MQHEALELVLRKEQVLALHIFLGAQSQGRQRLGFAASKQRGSVHTRQQTDFARNMANLVKASSVRTAALVQHIVAENILAQAVKSSLGQNALFFLIWFAVVFVFFSLSRSKLSPYLFPAFPPAAALAARGLLRDGPFGRGWGIAAILSGILPVAAIAIPSVRAATGEAHAWPLALLGAGGLVLGAFVCYAARRREEAALAALAAGWAVLYLTLALLWPRTALARDIHDLALAAKSAAVPGAAIVSYKTYVQTFPWVLKSIVPLADHTGELEDWWLPPDRRKEIFWPREDFWRRWRSGERLVVLLRKRDAEEFRGAEPAASLVAEGRKYEVVANFEPGAGVGPGPGNGKRETGNETR